MLLLAFLAAWKEACAYEGNKSILVVPGGTIFVRQVKFKGRATTLIGHPRLPLMGL